jgi:hypothetical protein
LHTLRWINLSLSNSSRVPRNTHWFVLLSLLGANNWFLFKILFSLTLNLP